MKITEKQGRNILTLIGALEGVHYLQGHNRLRLRNCFCCLGVACDLFRAAWGGRWHGDTFVVGDKWYTYRPPSSLFERTLGFHPAHDFERLGHDLAQANDSWASFKEIAILLRSVLVKAFGEGWITENREYYDKGKSHKPSQYQGIL